MVFQKKSFVKALHSKNVIFRPADLTASDSDETISVDWNDSQATIPYTDDFGYRIEWGPRLSTDSESAESETETNDTPELFSHKYIPDRELAPLSSSFVEDAESENEEQGVEEDVGVVAQETAITTVASINANDLEYLLANGLSVSPFISFWSRHATLYASILFICTCKPFQHSTEIPEIQTACAHAKRAVFAVQASGRFWIEEGLQGVNSTT